MRQGHAISHALLAGAFALVAIDCAHSAPLPFESTTDAGAGAPATPGSFRDAAPVLASPDAASPLQGCATATDDVIRSPIYMLVVLDGSGSMNDDEKWPAVVPSLEAFFDDIQQRNDPTFGVGLTIFSDANDTTQGKGPYPKIDVPVATVDAVQAAALHLRLDETRPYGQTPTLEVLQGQYAAMEAFAPALPLPAKGTKVVVFITDGVPYPDTDVQKQPSIDLAYHELTLAAPAGPITTFAVGVGYTFPYAPEEYDQVFMGNLAVAGGDPNQPCDPDELTVLWNMCHFQITPSGEPDPAELEMQFANAIDKIRSKVTSCELKLDIVDGGLLDPSKVNVQFTDALTGDVVLLPEDPNDGWTYDDPSAPTAVLLHGAACADLQNDPDSKVQVVLGCATIVK